MFHQDPKKSQDLSAKLSVISELRKKYASPKERKKSKLSLQDQLHLLLQHAQDEKKLLQELTSAAELYAKENLHQVGTSHYYTLAEIDDNELAEQKAKTKVARVTAINILFETLKSSSAYEVYQYVSSPDFQEQAGAKDHHFNFLRKHLWGISEQFITQYEQFLDLNHPDRLLDILLDESIAITQSQSAKLFWCYHPELVADVIVNFYENKTFEVKGFPDTGTTLDYDLLKRLLAKDPEAIWYINKKRYAIKASLLLPQDSCSPGKNVLAERGLTKDELYQYDEQAIYAAEQYLRNQYANLLVNNINDPEFGTLKEENIPYCFYQIPTAPYMLIDPTKKDDYQYFRYQDFKNDLKALLNSYDPNNNLFRKEIIFFGIINFDNTHYLPFFIYKNSKHACHVITVDPSPQVFIEGMNEGNDKKTRTYQLLKEIFQDLIPGCLFHDPKVNQMLRERDCGPHAATTLEVALSTATSKKPLLRMNNNTLQIDIEQLPIHSQPSGANFYTKQYVYPIQLEEDSFANRKKWAERLRSIQKTAPMTIRRNNSQTLSISDIYYIEDQISIDYNYDHSVDQQEHQDVRDVNISAVRVLFYNRVEGPEIIHSLIEEYQKTLILPSAEPIAHFIKSNKTAQELRGLVSAHGNLQALAEDVMLMLLKEYIPSALKTLFYTTVLVRLPTQTDLDSRRIVDEFLKSINKIYEKLSLHDQRMLKSELIILSEKMVSDKLEISNFQVVSRFFEKDSRNYLTKLPNKVLDVHDAVDELLEIAKKPECESFFENLELVKSLQYLCQHEEKKLRFFIQKLMDQFLNEAKAKTVSYLLNRLDLSEQNIGSLMVFYSKETGEFLPFEVNQLAEYLPDDFSSSVLSKKEMISVLGKLILDYMNGCIHQAVIAHIDDILTYDINFFLEKEEVKKAILPHRSLADLHGMLDQNGHLLKSAYEKMNLPNQYAGIRMLGNVHYFHPMIYKLMHDHFMRGVEKLVRDCLSQEYIKITQAIINVNHEIFIFKNMKDHPYLRHPTQMVDSQFERFLLSSHETVATFNDYFMDEYLNDKGRYFHAWFLEHQQLFVMKHFDQVNRINNNIGNAITLLSNFVSDLNDEKIIEIFMPHISRLIEMRTQILDFNLLDDQFNEAYQKYHQAFSNQLKFIFDFFIQQLGFKKGESTPGCFSAKIRPVLYSLLGMRPDPVLLSHEIKKLDEKMIKNKEVSIAHLNFDILPDSTLLILPDIHELPDTYNQPMTRDLLIQCIAYWFKRYTPPFMLKTITHDRRYDANYRDKQSEALISLLINIVNKTNSDEELKYEDLQALCHFLQNNNSSSFAIYSSNDCLDQIHAALTKTSHFSDKTPTTYYFSDVQQFFSGEKSTTKKQESSVPLSNNITQAELKRKGLWKIDLLGLTALEKRFAQIKAKHKQENFQLDTEDLVEIRRLLQDRWNRLLIKNNNQETKAAEHYVGELVDRRDKVYITMAEWLASYYRSQGEIIYTYELIMPRSILFLPSSQLRQHVFPQYICELSGYEPKDTNIDDISLRNLVITPTGDAFDMNWIVDQYTREEKLINFYTRKEFTSQELDVIYVHPKFKTVLDVIHLKFTNKITSRAIDLLVEYLNNAIFERGFGASYDENENNAAQTACQTVYEKAKKLFSWEAKSFWKERIPNDPNATTVQDIFNKSTNDCLTWQGVQLAKVVIAYKGNSHGLKSAKLIQYALEKGPIEPRQFDMPRVRDGRDVTQAEAYLYQKILNNNQGQNVKRMS